MNSGFNWTQEVRNYKSVWYARSDQGGFDLCRMVSWVYQPQHNSLRVWLDGFQNAIEFTDVAAQELVEQIEEYLDALVSDEDATDEADGE